MEGKGKGGTEGTRQLVEKREHTKDCGLYESISIHNLFLPIPVDPKS